MASDIQLPELTRALGMDIHTVGRMWALVVDALDKTADCRSNRVVPDALVSVAEPGLDDSQAEADKSGPAPASCGCIAAAVQAAVRRLGGIQVSPVLVVAE